MSADLERLSAALADRYRIERELGAGGMATVYLAQDLKHQRKVAIKVLRPELAAVLGAERFVQEISTTAQLQHPHILPLFDSGQAVVPPLHGVERGPGGEAPGGEAAFLYYVMPYIEGETLRDKLDRETQLGIDEALRIATEVADALDYAHRQGVVHRDIKPENILLHDGRPMVADFGIALALSAAAGGRMTETGLSLGTPHYMSPEQATADKDVTGRSDIYSLASVLYEMLTGDPPHVGSSAQQIIMKIVTEQAQLVTKLRKSVPPNVTAALAKALEKVPADRFGTAKEFAEALTNPAFTTTAMRPAAAAAAGSRWRSLALVATGVAVTLLGIVLWGRLRPASQPPTSRFAISLSEGTSLAGGSNIAVSRDGEVLVFPGVDSAGIQQLWIKRAGDLDATPIPGTVQGIGPFLSPDGSQLGFFQGAPRAMILVALAGGAPHVVADSLVGTGGASWAADGFIYFDADQGGIQRIRPDGSDRQTVLDLDERGTGFAWPEVLPDDRLLVVRLRHSGDTPEDFAIVASRIGTNKFSPLTKGVLARPHGDRLFVADADGTLRMWRLDAGAQAVRGPATVVATGLRVAGALAGVDLALDARGTLYYVAGRGNTGGRLEWVDSSGHRVPADSTWEVGWIIPGFSLSPDGGRVLVSEPTDSGRSLGWVKDLPVGPMTRIAVDTLHLNPAWVNAAWTPDGNAVLVSFTRGGGSAIYRQRADGLGARTLVVRDDRFLRWPQESRDGRWLVAGRADGAALSDIVAMQLGRDTVMRPVIATRAREGQPALSPDGRWLAYVSDKSGRDEIYVQPFPDVNGGIWQVSIDGGVEPHWSPAGDRLYFRMGLIGVLAVDVTTRPTFHAGLPHHVLDVSDLTGVGVWLGGGYAISPDGKRIMVVALGGGQEEALRLVRVEHVMTAANQGAGQ